MKTILIVMECTWVLLSPEDRQSLVEKSETKQIENIVTYLKLK